MDDAVKRVEEFLGDHDRYDGSEYLDVGYRDDVDLRASDIRAIIEENKRFRDALVEINEYDGGGFCGRISYCALKGGKP